MGTSNEKAYISIETNEGDESVGDIGNEISRQYQRQQRALKAQQEYTLAHRRLGHMSPKLIQMLFGTTTLPKAIQRTSKHCDTCDMAKIKKKRNHTISKRKKELLDQVSIDVCGKLLRGLYGQIFFLLIIDNYSHYTTVFTASRKDKCADELKT